MSLQSYWTHDTKPVVGCPKQIENYRQALLRIPAPGSRDGCHQALARVSWFARQAGVSAAEAERDIFSRIPPGSRRVPLSEVKDAVNYVYGSARQTTPRQASLPPQFNGSEVWDKIHRDESEEELEQLLRNASPVSLNYDSRHDSAELLTRFFKPDEFVLVGKTFTQKPLKSRAQLDHALNGTLRGPQVCPNPFTGEMGKTKQGKDSLRAADCVSDHRYLCVEFDDEVNAPIKKQLAFWLDQLETKTIRPSVIIHSGGKSLHAWIRVNCSSAEEWQRQIVLDIFPRVFAPLGADPNFRTPSQYSRLPGVERMNDDGSIRGFQRILWLNKQTEAGWQL